MWFCSCEMSEKITNHVTHIFEQDNPHISNSCEVLKILSNAVIKEDWTFKETKYL